MGSMENTLGFPEHFFRRVDETDDGLFYTQPRLVVHIDEFAIAAIRSYFDEVLPRHGAILDLMSSGARTCQRTPAVAVYSGWE